MTDTKPDLSDITAQLRIAGMAEEAMYSKGAGDLYFGSANEIDRLRAEVEGLKEQNADLEKAALKAYEDGVEHAFEAAQARATAAESALAAEREALGKLRYRFAKLERMHADAVGERDRLLSDRVALIGKCGLMREALERIANEPPDGYDVMGFARAALTSAPAQQGAGEVEDQSTIAAWADSVFGPHQGPVPPLLRSVNELVEACIAAGISQQDFRARADAEFVRQAKKGAAADLTNLPAEVAGTVIVLYRVAQAAGFDLRSAINAEMRKNRARKWFAKGDGTGHHMPAARAAGLTEGGPQ